LLFFRVRLYDPGPLFARLEPRLPFLWTWGFLFVSGCLILAASVLAWMERGTFVNQFAGGWSWRTVLLAWLALAVTTALHECAHGLTCKHFGGEVRDMGFLLMYFIPCFYCNVSDAWLFPQKWKRLWVTLAGPYCDLLLWALGLFAWRITQPGTMVHDFAWFVVSLCGMRVFFNVNPLLKLDGYYLLSDLVEIPNLRRRAREYFKAHLRWLLWGARRPDPEPRGRLLLGYGTVAWFFSLVFLTLTVAGFAVYFFSKATVLGIAWTMLLGYASAQRLFRDFSRGEMLAMVRERRKRGRMWVTLGALLATALAYVPIQDRVGGTFLIRPAGRAEIRAPVAGFLREVEADEGGWVSVGERVARLEVPDLESRLLQKQAERSESEAKLRLLQIGPRPEEVAEQRLRVERTRVWRDLARHDLERTGQALKAELAEIEGQIRQFRAESDRAAEALRRDLSLLTRRALQLDIFRESTKTWKVAVAQLAQAEARLRARLAEGTLKAEAELARRETEAAEAEAKLRLLEAGSRPEEIEAEKARHARIDEEIRFLEIQRSKLSLSSPVSGVIATPRLKEQVGRYFQEGDLITVVEAQSLVEAEVAVAEQEMERVRAGQPVLLKVRALPFQTFRTRVDRIAQVSLRAQERGVPAGARSSLPPPPTQTAATDASGSFVVYCVLDDPRHTLKTGMTGYARVLIGPTPIGGLLVNRVLRMIRTEFWW
jgi:multidrug resistance efflux pump